MMTKWTAAALAGLLSAACGQSQDLGDTGDESYPVVEGDLCSHVTDLTDFKVDDRFVYCLAYGCATVVDKRTSTSLPDVSWTTHCGGIGATGLAGDASKVYVSGVFMHSPMDEQGYIYSAPISGEELGLAPMFASATDDGPKAFHYVADIAVDGSRLYWATERGIYAAPKQGSAHAEDYVLLAEGELIDEDLPKTRIGLVVDEHNVYWSQRGAVMMVPKTGGQPVPLTAIPTTITSLVARHGWIYFAAKGAYRVSLSTRELQGFPIGPGVNGVDADEHYIYVSVADAEPSTNCSWEDVTGYVARMPIRGGDVEIIADGLPCPSQVTVDESAVYWRAERPHEGAKVHRVPKDP